MKMKIEIESETFWLIMDMLKKEIWYREADAESYKYMKSMNDTYIDCLKEATSLRKTRNDLYQAYKDAAMLL